MKAFLRKYSTSFLIILFSIGILYITSCEFKFSDPVAETPEDQNPEDITLVAPKDLVLTQTDTNVIEISWVDENVNITGFKIDKKINNDDWILSYLTTPNTAAMDANAENAILKYRVYAYYEDKVSQTTESDEFYNLIPAPANLSLLILDNNKIRLSWDDMSSTETGFAIDKKVGLLDWEDSYALADGDATTFVDDIEQPCGTFAYRLHSFNSDEFSENSNEESINLNLNLVGSLDTGSAANDVFISEETDWFAFIAGNYTGIGVADVAVQDLPWGINYDGGGLPDRAMAVSFRDTCAYLVSNSGLNSYGELAVVGVSKILHNHPLEDNPPDHLNVLATCPLSNNQSDTFEPHDILISGLYAYVANGENGLSIINIANHLNPFHISTVSTNGDARKVFIKDNTAYIANGADGVAMVDVSDPNNPVLESVNYPTTGLSNDVAVLDNYAFVADGENGLKIINLLTEDVSYLPTGGFVYSLHAQGQDRFQEDHVYLVDKELGIFVVDITDINNPYLLGLYEMDTMPVSLHKFFMSSYVYVADNGGLQIIQVAP